jgi:hypothetical protein
MDSKDSLKTADAIIALATLASNGDLLKQLKTARDEAAATGVDLMHAQVKSPSQMKEPTKEEIVST